MTKYVTLETWRAHNLSGTYDYFLMKEDGGDSWKVMCFNVVPEEDRATGEVDELEYQWEVTGVTVGYRDGNPNRPIQELFTEETARAEFERWRK